MTLLLNKPFPRLWSLEAGVAMVVTDLHGDEDAYRRYRDRFVDLQAKGEADWLILTGDLIHREQEDAPDPSLELVLDVLALQASYGQAVIYLCGNHELPHLYHFALTKGRRTYTPAFEASLAASPHRAEVITLFESLPFYIRTRAGVTLTHAGAAAPLANPANAQRLFSWNHRPLFDWADDLIAGEDVESLRRGYAKMQQAPYDLLAQYYLAVSGPADPRYNDLLRGFLATQHPEFNALLWPALFTRCEQDYGAADYAIFVEALLKEAAVDFYPQRALVAGHMTIPGGYQLVARHHLRLASAHHATPREAGQYLLIDVGKPIQRIDDLLSALRSVYR
ncbi:MAG: metallophosphoesterase [Anaerolineae bacterium]|nr:metallophosphoesterase [Anaerolineae bacterium]